MKHTLYNFFKRMKLSPSYFSKKYNFIIVNSFTLFLLSKQKHPLYHHTFQIAIFRQVSRTIQLHLHCLLSFLALFLKNFLAAILSLLWSIRRGQELTHAIFIWVSQLISKLRRLYRSTIFYSIFRNGNLLVWSICVT